MTKTEQSHSTNTKSKKGIKNGNMFFELRNKQNFLLENRKRNKLKERLFKKCKYIYIYISFSKRFLN